MNPFHQFLGGVGFLFAAAFLFRAMIEPDFGSAADWAGAAVNVVVVLVTLTLARRAENLSQAAREDARSAETASAWQAVDGVLTAIQEARATIDIDDPPSEDDFRRHMHDLINAETVASIFAKREISVELLSSLVGALAVVREAKAELERARASAYGPGIVFYSAALWRLSFKELEERAAGFVGSVLGS